MAAQVCDLPTHLLRRAILGFALVAPIFTVLFYRTNALIALSVLFLSHILLLYPTLVPNSQWWGPVITSFETSRPQVWITIDDGPDALHTSKVLDILDRFRARATFFVIGKRIAETPELTRDITLRGHQIANHTFSHPSGSFWIFLPGAIAKEIDQCSSEIIRSTQTIAKYFRAPAGLKNFFVHPIGARRDLQLVGWTVRGLDTLQRSPEAVAERIGRKTRPGAIVLLHEGHRTADNPEFHLKCLELTLSKLAERGYEFVIPAPEQLRPHVAEK